jgi:anti-sigma-K factor RskA
VVTDHPADHGPYEELAAGYALDALEPADEQRYLRHARECATCAQALAGFREVAAALADTAPPAEPRPQLADRIMVAALADLDAGHRPGSQPADSALHAGSSPVAPTAGAQGDAPEVPADAAAGPGDALPPGGVPPRLRPRRWLRPVTAAAAAALIAGGGIWAGLAGTAGSLPPPGASCVRTRGCYVIALKSAVTHRPVAQVMVDKTTASVIPAALKANNPADQIYVLWQVTGSDHPLAVGSFDVRSGAHARIRIGALPAPYHDTLAFAVSLENGRTIPAGPSLVLALGQVS